MSDGEILVVGQFEKLADWQSASSDLLANRGLQADVHRVSDESNRKLTHYRNPELSEGTIESIAGKGAAFFAFGSELWLFQSFGCLRCQPVES